MRPLKISHTKFVLTIYETEKLNGFYIKRNTLKLKKSNTANDYIFTLTEFLNGKTWIFNMENTIKKCVYESYFKMKTMSVADVDEKGLGKMAR